MTDIVEQIARTICGHTACLLSPPCRDDCQGRLETVMQEHGDTARAAISEVLDWLEEPSVESHNAGLAISRYGLGHMEMWKAMLAEMRKEALGDE